MTDTTSADTTAGTPNGLASLAQKRARRTMPPPRHPSRSVPESSNTSSAPPLLSPPTDVPPVPSQTADVGDPEPPALSTVTPARPVTVYLDDVQVSFLEQTRIAGLLGSPRLDVSKSAVVRLALRRLAEQLSAEQIREILRSQPTDPTRTGRKKR